MLFILGPVMLFILGPVSAMFLKQAKMGHEIIFQKLGLLLICCFSTYTYNNKHTN